MRCIVKKYINGRVFLSIMSVLLTKEWWCMYATANWSSSVQGIIGIPLSELTANYFRLTPWTQSYVNRNINYAVEIKFYKVRLLAAKAAEKNVFVLVCHTSYVERFPKGLAQRALWTTKRRGNSIKNASGNIITLNSYHCPFVQITTHKNL